ncbi:BREX-2 system phosphatase PglZ [Streptomyces halobius]|uniref:BREX-2 system phosphatase PglZ n=1 Tax=Streptomyces halobius TaxID=2879846 RepID=A0ABY4MHY7_9ACTN|nr:BREX-2 system phosphatase PglZ [Streptomyces halobius]UQA97317.1 BREX-2 system phosphatase PglZ [Streptomyces halobius]
MGTTVPELDQRVLTGLLSTRLTRTKGRRLVLVHGKYADGPEEFTVPVADGERRKVRVTHTTSVLGLTDAWQAHLNAVGTDLLVVTTDVRGEQLSLDLLGEMVRSQVIAVDEADIVRQLFGAADLDPRMRRDPWLWLPTALISAEPVDGWPQRGAVLTLDAAMRALVGVRLGLESVFDEGVSVDVDALLAWSRTPGGPERFAALPEAEQQGIADWLAQSAGEAAPLLLRLALNGRGAEATALGVLASVMTGDAASADAAVALGTLFGMVGFRPSELRAYARAVEGTLTRWIGEAAGRGPQSEQARQQVLDVLAQADRLADSAHLTAELADNPFLPSGFQARLHRFAEVLSEGPQAAQTAWEHVREHRLAAVFWPQRVELARMAVRLRHWLDTPQPVLSSVDQAVHAHVADWGWVDRALAHLWVGGADAEPELARAYRTVHEAARRRRAALDEAFAAELGPWTQHAGTAESGRAQLVEDVLRRVAVKLAAPGKRPPLVLVLDGMNSAVAAQLGEELTGAGRWSELAAGGRRAAFVAMVPSVPVISRATLLCGQPAMGGEEVEKEGFAAFWRQHQRTACLFHKSDIAGSAGHPLDPRLVAAIASDAVVGVVLNALAESLDHGQQSALADWTVNKVKYLPELLNSARGQGRPVVLVSAHGHVLDRTGPGTPLLAAEGVEAARWRTGTAAAEGEVVLAGPRVLENRGRVTVPWSEEIRYSPRKAGYHGGASLAEMTVPVLVLAPSADSAPAGWSELPRESIQPSWWEADHGQSPPPDAGVTQPTKNTATAKPNTRPPEGERTTDEAVEVPAVGADPVQSATLPTLGRQVVDTKIYGRQGVFVRMAPPRKAVAAVIDHLDAAGGTLSLPAVLAAFIAAGGRKNTKADGLVTQLTRLLNVEGYEIVSLIDSRTRVRLNRETLREQFELPRGNEGST